MNTNKGLVYAVYPSRRLEPVNVNHGGSRVGRDQNPPGTEGKPSFARFLNASRRFVSQRGRSKQYRMGVVQGFRGAYATQKHGVTLQDIILECYDAGHGMSESDTKNFVAKARYIGNSPSFHTSLTSDQMNKVIHELHASRLSHSALSAAAFVVSEHGEPLLSTLIPSVLLLVDAKDVKAYPKTAARSYLSQLLRGLANVTLKR